MLLLLHFTVATFNPLLFTFIESMMLILYGIDVFLVNMGEMGVKATGWIRGYWKMCWVCITPAAIILILSTRYNDYLSESARISGVFEERAADDNPQDVPDVLQMLLLAFPFALSALGVFVAVRRNIKRGDGWMVLLRPTAAWPRRKRRDGT